MQNQNEQKNFKSHSQTIGTLAQAIVKNAENSVMTSPPSPIISEATTLPATIDSQIGIKPSTHGSATMRDLAVAAVEGRTGIISDNHLRILLESHFQSRLDIKSKTNYGTEDAPTFQTTGFQVTICRADGDEKISQWLQAMNRPSKSEFVAGKLARLRVMMARRGESDRDVTILMDTMMDLCRNYPADAIADVTDYWLRTQKFFPKASEFIELLEEKVMLRRAVLAALEPKALQIEKREPPKTYKEVPKDKWDATMWSAYIGDAEAMHKLALDNPNFMDAAAWAAEVIARKAQIPAPVQGTEGAAAEEARVMA